MRSFKNILVIDHIKNRQYSQKLLRVVWKSLDIIYTLLLCIDSLQELICDVGHNLGNFPMPLTFIFSNVVPPSRQHRRHRY